jgi:hypothetical protein
VEVWPIQTIREYFQPNKKTRVFERACIVAKKGAKRPIFEGNTPQKKMYPQKWPLYDGHSMKAVNNLRAGTTLHLFR